MFVARQRDAAAAHRFSEQAIGTTKVTPAEVTTDRAPVYPAVLETSYRRHGTEPSGTPTTASSVTTAG